MTGLDITETEAAILAQAAVAVARHHCDGCPWCAVAAATAEVLAEVNP